MQIDGCGEPSGKDEVYKPVMILAATNLPWDLDEAIIRRLSKRVCKCKCITYLLT